MKQSMKKIAALMGISAVMMSSQTKKDDVHVLENPHRDDLIYPVHTPGGAGYGLPGSLSFQKKGSKGHKGKRKFVGNNGSHRKKTLLKRKK